jgi:hypothetical protein
VTVSSWRWSGPVVAEQLHGAERAAAWQQITAAAPLFAQ